MQELQAQAQVQDLLKVLNQAQDLLKVLDQEQQKEVAQLKAVLEQIFPQVKQLIYPDQDRLL